VKVGRFEHRATDDIPAVADQDLEHKPLHADLVQRLDIEIPIRSGKAGPSTSRNV